MKSIKTYLCVFSGLLYYYLCSVSFLYSQTVVNNGDNIVVNPGAYFVIAGDYINLKAYEDGKVDLDGTMLIDGNWVNNAPSPVFTNIEYVPDGNVVLRGSSPQYIGGIDSTNFENLFLTNSTKTLEVSDCEVNGVLTIDAILNLNSKKIIINNSSPSGINYISNYIHSETSPIDGYGEVQWNIGSSLNTYSVPFGSGNSGNNDHNLVLSTLTPGFSSNKGNISFATYPANCNNEVLPAGVNLLDREAEIVANRYWIINPDFDILKPDINIVFKYTSNDLDVCNENINEENLKAMRYNTSLMTWNDIDPIGKSNRNEKTVSTGTVFKNDFYAPWALFAERPFSFYMPNVFTPDGNGLNDFFGPVGIDLLKYKFTMYIYDRWGKIIYETTNGNKMWDGYPNGSNKIAPFGVYIWHIILFDENNNTHNYFGRVTILL